MKITVVCPVHNEEKYLPYTIPSLKAIEEEVYEYIFIIDNCTDRSEEILRRLFPDAKYIYVEKHRWRFYIAENWSLGFREAGGDVILCTACDLAVDPSIPGMIRRVFRDPSIGLVCFRYLNYSLDRYYNPRLKAFEHFRFPRLFLRRTKNAFISFASERLVHALKDAEPIGYNAWKLRAEHRNLKPRFQEARRLYATYLHDRGVPSEIIDLLQGRIPASVFARYYYRPDLQEAGVKVLEALKPLEEAVLD